MNDALREGLRCRSLWAAVLVGLAIVGVWCAVMRIGDFELNSALIALVVMVVPVSYVALCSNETAAARWASERGADLGPTWTPVLYRYLLRSRVARTVGVTFGFAFPFMMMSRYNADPQRSGLLPISVDVGSRRAPMSSSPTRSSQGPRPPMRWSGR